jgi:hypothetical protein
MLGGWLRGHEIDDVHHPNPQIREMSSEQINSSKSLERWDIAGASHHYVGFIFLIVTRPTPDPDTRRAVLDSCAVSIRSGFGVPSESSVR